MNDLDRKQKLVMDHERGFAFTLGGRVIGKPRLSVWMILIPIIIIWHMFRFKKYVEARNAFGKNYLKPREQAMQALRESLETNSLLRLQEIVDRMHLPPEARAPYRELLGVLAGHFRDLLAAEGEDMHGLLRRAYRSRVNYLLYVNRLGQVEKRLHAALRPAIKGDGGEIKKAVSRIETIADLLRREEAERVFS